MMARPPPRASPNRTFAKIPSCAAIYGTDFHGVLPLDAFRPSEGPLDIYSGAARSERWDIFNSVLFYTLISLSTGIRFQLTLDDWLDPGAILDSLKRFAES